jgi:hypothetical protein
MCIFYLMYDFSFSKVVHYFRYGFLIVSNFHYNGYFELVLFNIVENYRHLFILSLRTCNCLVDPMKGPKKIVTREKKKGPTKLNNMILLVSAVCRCVDSTGHQDGYLTARHVYMIVVYCMIIGFAIIIC